MKMGVVTYEFDVLRLMLNTFLEKIIFVQSLESYSNVLAVKTLISQHFCHNI